MSKLGLAFSGPAGEEIPNYGEQDAIFDTDEGVGCKMVIQISDVDRVLLSAAEMTDNGFEVVLKKTYGYITNLKTKKTIRLQRKGGVGCELYKSKGSFSKCPNYRDIMPTDDGGKGLIKIIRHK